MLDLRPPNTGESGLNKCTRKARMPADAHADAQRPLRRTTADAKNTGKKAADAFPAFEKYKVVHSNPPCGCPMGCGTLYGGEGVFWSLFAFPWGSLRSTSPCHALSSDELTSNHSFLPNLRLQRVAFPSRVSPPRMLPSRVDSLHTEAEAFTQIIFAHESYTHYTQKLLHEEVFTQSSF